MNREQVGSKTQTVIESVEQLRQLSQCSYEEFSTDLRNLDSAEHRLQISIEALLDLGAFIIGQLGLRTPQRHADIPEILAEAKEFPMEEVENLQRMVAFRNRILHLYNRIDPNRVWEIVRDRTDDLPRILNLLLEVIDRHP